MTRNVLAVALVASVALMSTAGLAQLQKRQVEEKSPYPAPFETPQTAREIPFDPPDPDYFVLPGEANFGEIAAVATNSKGHVFRLSRSNAKGNLHGGSATQLFEFDDKGKYVRELGRDLYSFGYGHGVRVDKDDNIWVVDKGTDMVTKINNKTGKVMMVLGRREELSAHYWRPEPAEAQQTRDGWFREPTDIAWDSKGNIYVSDGYLNSRIAKYDKDGAWVGTWGKRGSGPGEFWTPHNIAVDANDHIWVADRANGRLQVFDTEGNFLKEVIINVATPKRQPLLGHQFPPSMDALKSGRPFNLAYRPGAPDALCIPPANPNVIFVGDLYPGRVYKIDLNGKVLGYFGQVGKRPG
jgi:hypothetical protein